MLLVLVASAFPATASSQNDAGSGGDAPDRSGEALPVALGSHAGLLQYDQADVEDWYVVNVSEGLLRLTFSAQGGAYGGIYRADGSYLTNAYSSGDSVTLHSDGPGTFRIGFGEAGRTWGATNYTFTVEQVSGVPPAQDDAGCGCDAPREREWWRVRLTEEGTYNGTLDPANNDTEDWYYGWFNAPSLRLRVDGPGIEVVFRGVHFQTPADIQADYSDGPIGIVALDETAGAYTFQIELPPRPDARFVSIDAEPVMVETLGGRGESSSHVITVVGENAGDGAGDIGGVVAIRNARGSVAWLSLETRLLQPGESTTWQVEWSTLGHVGRYSAHGSVGTRWDSDWSNNRGSTEEWVLVRAPFGV